MLIERKNFATEEGTRSGANPPGEMAEEVALKARSLLRFECVGGQKRLSVRLARRGW